MLSVAKGKDRFLVHPLTDRCHVNDDKWMRIGGLKAKCHGFKDGNDDYLNV